MSLCLTLFYCSRDLCNHKSRINFSSHVVVPDIFYINRIQIGIIQISDGCKNIIIPTPGVLIICGHIGLTFYLNGACWLCVSIFIKTLWHTDYFLPPPCWATYSLYTQVWSKYYTPEKLITTSPRNGIVSSRNVCTNNIRIKICSATLTMDLDRNNKDVIRKSLLSQTFPLMYL